MNKMRDFDFAFPFCQTQRVSLPEFWERMLSPRVLAYFLIVGFVHTTFNPSAFDSAERYGLVAVLWIVGSMVYLATHLSIIFAVLWLWPSGKTPIYNQIFGTLAATAASTFVMLEIGAVVLLPADLIGASFASMYGIAVLRMIPFEWLFFHHIFFFPLNQKESDLLMIGDREFSIHDLLYVRANEHRVCIYTKSGSFVERTRMKDLVNVLSTEDGIQPHRSYWVPKYSISEARCRDEKLVIVVEDGTEISVARTRRDPVQKWLFDMSIPIHT